VYEDRFEDPAAFDLILSRAQAVLEQRGLRNAKLGRVAISAWSAGYGGVLKLLGDERLAQRIDAVLLLDAIHCGYEDARSKRLKRFQIEPMERFARRAAEGRALFFITHSEIEPTGYLSARRTTDLLLDAVGVPRTSTSAGQPLPALATMADVLPKAMMTPLSPLSEANRGGLHVRGYGGDGPASHMMHLVQMSTIALPELARYWKR
jgi:hypothetical protein